MIYQLQVKGGSCHVPADPVNPFNTYSFFKYIDMIAPLHEYLIH